MSQQHGYCSTIKCWILLGRTKCYNLNVCCYRLHSCIYIDSNSDDTVLIKSQTVTFDEIKWKEKNNRYFTTGVIFTKKKKVISRFHQQIDSDVRSRNRIITMIHYRESYLLDSDVHNEVFIILYLCFILLVEEFLSLVVYYTTLLSNQAVKTYYLTISCPYCLSSK